jgi:predicted ATPase
LDQLLSAPENPDRQRQELEFRCGLAAALQAVKGAGAPETGHAYARARELWERLGSPSEFLHVPWGQSRYHVYRGEYDLALRLAEDVLDRSSQRADSGGLVLGHQSAGHSLLLAGKFAACRLHFEEVLALYDPIPHRSLAHQAGHHPQINAQSLLGLALFCLGYPEQAVARSNAAMAEARGLAHPPSLVVGLANSILLLWLIGDDAALNERADELVAVAAEQGFPVWYALGTIFRGWVKVKTGDVAEGLCLLRSGSATNRATGAELIVPYSLALLAEAYEIAGQSAEAMTQVDDALEIVERTGEHWFAAKLYGHKGRLLLGQGHSEAAEELYQKALSIAREQAAKLWELRAAVSLARLRRDQGRRAEARGLLAPVYGWFTEGFDTPDLKDAKALLDGGGQNGRLEG